MTGSDKLVVANLMNRMARFDIGCRAIIDVQNLEQLDLTSVVEKIRNPLIAIIGDLDMVIEEAAYL